MYMAGSTFGSASNIKHTPCKHCVRCTVCCEVCCLPQHLLLIGCPYGPRQCIAYVPSAPWPWLQCSFDSQCAQATWLTTSNRNRKPGNLTEILQRRPERRCASILRIWMRQSNKDAWRTWSMDQRTRKGTAEGERGQGVPGDPTARKSRSESLEQLTPSRPTSSNTPGPPRRRPRDVRRHMQRGQRKSQPQATQSRATTHSLRRWSKVLYPTWLLFCHVCASGPDLSSGNCIPSHASDVTLIVGSALRVMSKQLSCDTLAESLDACACVHAPPLLNCVRITL